MGFIANLRYGLPYATEVSFGGVLTGIRGIGEVGVFGSKPLKNRLKRGGGVFRGLEGLTVGLEVL